MDDEILSQLQARYIRMRERAERAEADRDHWKANHDNMAKRNAVLSQRPDLLVDRLPAIKRYEEELAGYRNQKPVGYVTRAGILRLREGLLLDGAGISNHRTGALKVPLYAAPTLDDGEE